ncbi:hypothetical protein, partial [Blautia sp.]|uniref:hypothetical protein n=1 Tax=Blautia sp. TaxID=1955243 RepID=UPI002A80226C
INIKGLGDYYIISMCRYAQSCAFISVIELPRIPAYCPKNVASSIGVRIKSPVFNRYISYYYNPS